MATNGIPVIDQNVENVHFEDVLTEGIITEKMVQDEERILDEIEQATPEHENDITEQTKISKEERYEQLQKLLMYSKLYTQFLQKKVQDCHDEQKLKVKCETQTTAVKENADFTFKTHSRGTKKRGLHQSYPSLKKAKIEIRRIDEMENIINSNNQPRLLTGGTMRQYQLEGFQWLKALFENGVNGILGDEMGLGKTIQCISIIAHLIENQVPGPFLVCAPVSTLPNWVAEFKKFAPKIPVMLYYGTKEERAHLRPKISKVNRFDDYISYPVVITSYEMVIRDNAALGRHKWKYLVVDEGHRIKNTKCQLLRCLKMLPSLNRLLLTGTPLQNNLAELWSLLNFILPEIFDDLDIFESWFDVSAALCGEGGDEHIVKMERENHILSTLHEILSPFLLRRIKADIDLLIPSKKELLVMAPLTTLQQKYYQALLDKSIELLMPFKPVEGEQVILDRSARRIKQRPAVDVSRHWLPERNIKMANIMMQLRKCCNHPYLLEYPIDPRNGDYKIDEDLIYSSGKLLVLDSLIQKLNDRGHKTLIFSQMVKMLDVLHDYCYMKNYKFSRLDGTMRMVDRQAAIDEFNNNPEVSLFLLSTRAGGLGLNLTAADTVIIYDSDWNPQCDLQAMDRCHRIGQSKPVVVYRFVTAGTIDQKIVDRAAAKRKLEKIVIHKDRFKSCDRDLVSELSPAELLKLLRSSDHDAIIHSGDGEVFTKEEWDVLLNRDVSKKPVDYDFTAARVKLLENE